MGLILTDTLVAGGRWVKWEQSGDSPRSLSLYHCHKACRLRVLGSCMVSFSHIWQEVTVCMRNERKPSRCRVQNWAAVVLFLPPSLFYLSVRSPFLSPFVLYLILHFLSLSSFNLRKLPGLWGSTLCRYSMHAVGSHDGACTIGRLILNWAPALRTALLSLLRQHERLGFVEMYGTE